MTRNESKLKHILMMIVIAKKLLMMKRLKMMNRQKCERMRRCLGLVNKYKALQRKNGRNGLIKN
jgi:hypothetical protein